jgi:hypothetical protein
MGQVLCFAVLSYSVLYCKVDFTVLVCNSLHSTYKVMQGLHQKYFCAPSEEFYVLSCPVLSYPVLSCPVLSCPALHCAALRNFPEFREIIVTKFC